MDDNAKEILAYWDGALIMKALIPKARGTGFLLVPAGHHSDQRINDLEDETGASIFGLDGNLEVDASHLTCQLEQGWSGFVQGMERLYPYPVRIVDAAEFWAKHPVRTQSPEETLATKP